MVFRPVYEIIDPDNPNKIYFDGDSRNIGSGRKGEKIKVKFKLSVDDEPGKRYFYIQEMRDPKSFRFEKTASGSVVPDKVTTMDVSVSGEDKYTDSEGYQEVTIKIYMAPEKLPEYGSNFDPSRSTLVVTQQWILRALPALHKIELGLAQSETWKKYDRKLKLQWDITAEGVSEKKLKEIYELAVSIRSTWGTYYSERFNFNTFQKRGEHAFELPLATERVEVYATLSKKKSGEEQFPDHVGTGAMEFARDMTEIPLNLDFDTGHGSRYSPFHMNFRIVDPNPANTSVSATAVLYVNGDLYTELFRDRKVSVKTWHSITIDAATIKALQKQYLHCECQVQLTVRNDNGITATKNGYFRVVAPPVNLTITGDGESLGNRTSPFSVHYTATTTGQGALSAVVYLDGSEFRRIPSVPSGAEQTIAITKAEFEKFSQNVRHQLRVEVRSADPGVSPVSKSWTFTRTNSAPVLAGSDEDLGEKSAPFAFSFTASDPDNDALSAQIFLDNQLFKEITEVKPGEAQTVTVDKMAMAVMEPEAVHTFRVEVKDSHGTVSVRRFTFKRVLSDLSYTFRRDSDLRVAKAVISPTWELGAGAVAKVEVCNNANDESPTWEDMTEQVKVKRHYNLTNSSKTAEKWAFGARVTITKGSERSILKGFGGAYQ